MALGSFFGWMGGGGGTSGGGVNSKYGTATGEPTIPGPPSGVSFDGTITGLTSMAAGQVLFMYFTNANTGPSTLNPNGLGALTMLKFGDTALESGDIKANQIMLMQYDGTNLQILSVTDNIMVGP